MSDGGEITGCKEEEEQLLERYAVKSPNNHRVDPQQEASCLIAALKIRRTEMQVVDLQYARGVLPFALIISNCDL